MKMTVAEIVKACGGILLSGDPETVVSSVCTDSRQVEEGALFVPIRGERTDSHIYIDAVFASGAAATLTQNEKDKPDGRPRIYVPDTVEALQKIALAYRSRFSIPVIGVTGSVGKTTTKEMVALVLSASYNVMKTEGNQNSQIGLPLTLFRLEESHQAAVIEMGMSDFGEMAKLAAMAQPRYAIMTNIGISHIQQLKTQENILKEKLHITDTFTESSVLFLNGEDPMLASLKTGLPSVRKVYFGLQPWCDYRAEAIETSPQGTRFQFTGQGVSVPVWIPVPGNHNVLNALAGLALVHTLGGNVEAGAKALSGYETPAMRQQIHKVNGITVIDDSYNASPDALRGSLQVLCGFPGRKVAVLADMLELGEAEENAHRQVGKTAASLGVDCVFTVGTRAAWIAEEAASSGVKTVKTFENNQEISAFLRSFLQEGDTLLVKGSRGMHMDEVVQAVLGFAHLA